MTPATRIIIGRPRYTPQAREYFARSGVTAPTARAALDNLVRVLITAGIWSDTLVVPMKSTQNAGTGSTAFTLGGWRQDDVTLVNAPTWGTTGLTFTSASNTYGLVTLPGLAALTGMTSLARVIPSSASSPDTNTHNAPWTFGDVNGSGNSVHGFTGISTTTSLFSGETLIVATQLKGAATIGRLGTSNYTWGANEDQVMYWQTTPTGTNLWKNKSLVTMNFSNVIVQASDITPSSASYVATDATQVLIGGSNIITPTGAMDGVISALVFIRNQALGTTAREAVIDAVNAL